MPSKNSNHLYKATFKKTDLFAAWITNKIGTIGFFIIILVWTTIWLSWNLFAPPKYQYDPYPAFVLWLFISNMIQIFLMPLIMVGQNLQGRHSEVRAENDYVINVKAEKEIAEIKKELAEIKKLFVQFLSKN